MKYVVGECKVGRGVFAAEPIAAGETILHYSGPFLTYAETTPKTLALQVTPDLYLGESGNADDFVNHSCDPNAGIVIEGEGRGVQVRLIAIRPIETGKEIFFDYSTTMDEDDFEMQCWCGSPACRTIIRDFKHLPDSLKQKYAELGVVPEYNRRYL